MCVCVCVDVAWADAIKILNDDDDDDALELFKNNSPKCIDSSARVFEGNPSFDFISLALKGEKIGMEKVIKLIDDLVAEPKQDQINDDSEKEYCAVQVYLSDDKKKGLEKSISDLETAIVEAKDGIITLKDEIDVLRLSVFYSNGHS